MTHEVPTDVHRLVDERDDLSAALFDTVHEMLRQKERAEIAEATVAVLRGDECEANGDGPCGVCRKCTARMRAELEPLWMERDALKTRLEKAEAQVRETTAEVERLTWIANGAKMRGEM